VDLPQTITAKSITLLMLRQMNTLETTNNYLQKEHFDFKGT
jgi:hypothetical protein